MLDAKPHRHTLRRRITATVCLCVLALALASGALGYAVFRWHLYDELDHALTDKLRFFEGACVRKADGRTALVMPETVWDSINDRADPEYFVYRLPSGRTFYRSRSLEGADLPALGMGGPAPAFADVELPGGERGRCVGTMFTVPAADGAPPSGAQMHLVVAHPQEHVRAALGQYLRLAALAIGSATALLMLAAAWAVRRNLHPLDELTRQIDATGVGGPGGRRFDLPGAPGELAPVVGRLNLLMDRVDAAMRREREFTSDAAHELRNPVAAIRTQLELALRRERSPEDYRATIRSVLEVDVQLGHLVDRLLLLARLESGEAAGGTEREEVDLEAMARACWAEVAPAAEARGLRWRIDVAPGSRRIVSAPALLQIVLRNLFDNAAEYAPGGGEVAFSATPDGGGVALRVTNAAPDLDPERAVGLFRRFHREDPAHDARPGHTGIGLSLCAKIAEVLGGRIDAAVEGDRLTVCLRLPPHPPGGEKGRADSDSVQLPGPRSA